MSLQIIAGASGSGKSYRLFQNIIESSIENPDKNYIVVVPEQFTMSTQKELVRLTPNHAISNIDVVSFARLAYRVMEETGRAGTAVMDEIGKSLILRRVAGQKEDDLTILGGNMKRIGYISEMKSIISEFTQYSVSPERLEKLIEDGQAFGALEYKLKDLLIIYKAFQEEIKDRYITPEEVLSVMADCAGISKILKDSIIAFDGFTGFTPIQYNVIEKLLQVSDKVIITITLEGQYDASKEPLDHELFCLSKTTIKKLTDHANNIGVSVDDIEYIEGNHRLGDNDELLFLERNLFRYSHKSYENDPEKVKVIRCLNPEKELEFIAGEINRLIREEGLRYRDFSIVTGDVATYSRLAPHVMKAYNIPVFMDYKRDVLHNPFIECIRAALSVVSDNFSFNSMFRYIKCGMLDIPADDIFMTENYCIAKGIKGRKKWGRTWKNYKNSLFTDDDIDRINEAREKICKSLFALADSFKGNSTVKEKTLGLYAFLQEINAQQQLHAMELKFTEAGDFAKEKEYSQIYKIVIDLLDEYVDLLGDEEMSGEDYNQILDAGFSEARIGIIPPGMDMVTLGDITRTRLGDIKVLFFAGVNDGIIPAADAGAGLISQTERTLLSGKVDLAPTVREKSYIQRFYLYLNMTKPKDKLYISYSALSSDGSGLMPSYLIATVTELFGNSIQSQAVAGAERLSTPESSLVYLTEHFSKALSGDEDALWRDLYRWYMDSEEYSQRVKRLTEAGTYSYDPSEDNLDQDLARKLYGEFLKNSVTRLELYSKCAFAHFLQRGLKLSEREEFEITPLEIGSTVHSAIELFTKKMMDMDYGWSTLPEDLLESMTDQCVEETADTMFTDLFKASSRNEYMINRIKRLMKRTVWGLKKQMQSGLFEQGYAEYPINFDIKSKDADDLKVWMTGVIDRMDVYKKDDKVYVKIIDYKTGSRDFDITRFYNGLSMQLGVYLEGAMKELSKENPGSEVIPAGIFYYNVSDPIVRGEPGMTEDEAQNSVAKELRMKGLCNNDPEIARTMDMNGSGASSVLPVSFNKDGSIKESKAAVSTDSFEDMRRYLDKMICSLAGEILSGKGEINPYELKEETGCDYCTFRAVCRFDQSIEGFCFRECSEASWNDIGCHSKQSEES